MVVGTGRGVMRKEQRCQGGEGARRRRRRRRKRRT
jgi:hypothetical protein